MLRFLSDYLSVFNGIFQMEMVNADFEEKFKADAKNSLEEYCYNIRNKIESDQVNS